MKVLMVTPSFYPIKGGAETIIHEMSVKLNEAGIQTDILTFNMDRKWEPYWHYRTEVKDGVRIYKIPALNWLPVAHSDRVTQGVNLIPGYFMHILRKYDIIHFHGGDMTLPLFAYTLKKPKIFQSHGFLLNFYKRYFLSRFILKNIAHLYIAITEQMWKEFIELGINKDKVIYLPNSVDVEKFFPAGQKNSNLVLFAGRITYSKGVHVLLRSLRLLRNRVHLVLIGPSDWDSRYFNYIRRQIDEENERGYHKIEYVGEQEQRDMVKWYQRSSIFVLPSLKEALPMTILESLACGTPVIATAVGGITEIIGNNENGIIVPPNDEKKLAEAIDYLLQNEDLRIRLGQSGRRKVVENYSYTTAIEKLSRIYQRALQCQV